MKPLIKDAWVAALRNGRYKQGYKVLRSAGNHFCCLGVLCDILETDRWKLVKEYDAYHYGEKSATSLSWEMSRRVEMGRKIMNRLIEMNDSENCSFDQIADWIEENL